MTTFPPPNPTNSHGDMARELRASACIAVGDDRANCSARAGKNFRGAAWMDMPPQHREGPAPVATSGFSERHTDSGFRTESLKTGAGFEPCRHGTIYGEMRRHMNDSTVRLVHRTAECPVKISAFPCHITRPHRREHRHRTASGVPK